MDIMSSRDGFAPKLSWDCELSRSSELDHEIVKALELRTVLRGGADVGFDAFLPAAMYE